jgi:lactate permease
MLRVWQPREAWYFDAETDEGNEQLQRPAAAGQSYTRREIASAWVPWVILSACVFLWGVPAWKTILTTPTTEKLWPFPYLHEQVQVDTSVIGGEAAPKKAEFRFNWLSATGTGILVAAVLSAFWLRIGPRQFIRHFLHTLYRLRWSLLTISAMMAIAYLTQYSGSDVTLGLAFTRTGVLYPFFAAMLGWLGVALTGSDTSSNALFGNLQRITAERLGLSPILICAANSTGGVMGKMIDAQSIVVASAATNRPGEEGQILRFVFWPSVTLAALMGLLTLAQAYLLPWMIP